MAYFICQIRYSTVNGFVFFLNVDHYGVLWEQMFVWESYETFIYY